MSYYGKLLLLRLPCSTRYRNLFDTYRDAARLSIQLKIQISQPSFSTREARSLMSVDKREESVRQNIFYLFRFFRRCSFNIRGARSGTAIARNFASTISDKRGKRGTGERTEKYFVSILSHLNIFNERTRIYLIDDGDRVRYELIQTLTRGTSTGSSGWSNRKRKK